MTNKYVMTITVLILIVTCGLLFSVLFKVESQNCQNIVDAIRLAFIKFILLFSLLSFISAEGLSIFNGLNRINLSIFWGLVGCACIPFIHFNFQKKFDELKEYCASLEPTFFWYIVTVTVLIVIPLLILAIYVPPNNYDSMTYHMSRIEHWRQNQNVYPYSTVNIRQVIHNPLSEYLIANFLITSEIDIFSNLVQFFSWIGVLCALTLITKELNFGRLHQFVVGIIFVSIPMGIFQSTTTQNDLFGAFFLVSFIYFGLGIKGQFDLGKFIFVIVSLILGGFTKYTVFVFGLPFAIYFSIVFLRSLNFKETFKLIFLGLAFTAFIFAPFLLRNYLTYGSLSGDDEMSSRMQNSSINFSIGISNFIKHLFDHFYLPIGSYSNFLNQLVIYFHTIIGISKDNPEANFLNIPYSPSFILSENITGSLFHVLLFIFSTIIGMMYFKKYPKIAVFIVCSWLGFFLYSLVFKWQPWQVRLMLPWMIVTSIPCGIFVANFLSFKTYKFHVFILGLIVYSAIPVYFNISKPLIDPIGLFRQINKSPKGVLTEDEIQLIPAKLKDKFLKYYEPNDIGLKLKMTLSKSQRRALYELEDSLNFFKNERKSLFTLGRNELYYLSNKSLFQKHTEIVNQINGINPQVELRIGSDSYEYPLWILLREKFGDNFRITWKNEFKIDFANNPDIISNKNRYLIVEFGNRLQLLDVSKNRLLFNQ